MSQSTSKLQCLHVGAWGALQLLTPQLPMPHLDTPHGCVADVHDASCSLKRTTPPCPRSLLRTSSTTTILSRNISGTMPSSQSRMCAMRACLKKIRTCGEGGVVAEMYQYTGVGVALVLCSQRAAHEQFRFRFLGKKCPHCVFPSPSPLLPSSANLWSRGMLGVLEKCDAPDDQSHLGFKKGRLAPSSSASCAQRWRKGWVAA